LAILCVQEPYNLGGRPVGPPVRSRCVSSGPNPMAAILVLDDKVGVLRLEHLCSRHTGVAEISVPRLSFVLVNQFYQFADAIDVYLGELREVIMAARGRPVVAVMDANAKSPIWGSQDICERGEAFENIILDCDLNLLNDPARRDPPTRGLGRGASLTCRWSPPPSFIMWPNGKSTHNARRVIIT